MIDDASMFKLDDGVNAEPADSPSTSGNIAAPSSTFLTALPTGDNVVTLRCTSWQMGEGVGTLRYAHNKYTILHI